MSKTVSFPYRPCRPVEAVILDMWGMGWLGVDREPTKKVYDGLGLSSCGVSMEEHFLPRALTIPRCDPSSYLVNLAQCYNLAVPSLLHDVLRELVEAETGELLLGRILPKPVVDTIPGAPPESYAPGRSGMFEDVRPCVVTLKEMGKTVALGTNTWSLCDVRRVLESYGVLRFFDQVLLSSELGMAKQAGVEFFLTCARIMGLPPEACAVADDNLRMAVIPAALAGMQPILVDRWHQYTDRHGRSLLNGDGSAMYPELELFDIRVIHNLDALPAVLR